MINRRRFLQSVAASILTARSGCSYGNAPVQKIRAAALQMTPRLGDVESNLGQAQQLVETAVRKGAGWIILPEMFTSAAAFHEDMIRAIRPHDGAPTRLMRDMAKRNRVAVGGSFLASEGNRVFNRFLLFLPNGSSYRHDKDQPTYWETCYYENGNDEGVLLTPGLEVGVALCWEMIRTRTARRLRGKIRLLLAGSTWWTLPDEAPEEHPFRKANLEMLKQAPVSMARMLAFQSYTPRM